MKITLMISLLVFAFVSPMVVSAKMYKGYDAEGNVIFSDIPFEDAEKYSPPPISVVETPQVKAQKKTVNDARIAQEEKRKNFKYIDFDVSSPAQNQVFWNESNLAISLHLKPALNVAEGHKIWLLIDNVAKVKNSQNTSFSIGRLERGTHKVQALVKDSSGKIVVRTRTNLFFIKQGSR